MYLTTDNFHNQTQSRNSSFNGTDFLLSALSRGQKLVSRLNSFFDWRCVGGKNSYSPQSTCGSNPPFEDLTDDFFFSKGSAAQSSRKMTLRILLGYT